MDSCQSGLHHPNNRHPNYLVHHRRPPQKYRRHPGPWSQSFHPDDVDHGNSDYREDKTYILIIDSSDLLKVYDIFHINKVKGTFLFLIKLKQTFTNIDFAIAL